VVQVGASLKKSLLAPLRAPGVAKALSSMSGTCASIFMLHRFSCPEEGVTGHEPAKVRTVLSHLRNEGYDLISLREMFRRLRDGEPLRRAIAFTIDDGYFDHGSIAGPIFAEFDCPVTIFAVSGFLDGMDWLWWDRAQFICEATSKTQLTVCVGGEQRVFKLDSMEARQSAALAISIWCQDASQANRSACLANLAKDAEVELPAKPPQRFAPISWNEARQLEKQGVVSFGPHTVTHPVLSSTTEEHARLEISESWKRISAELASPVPIFCYPHGRQRDFGTREMDEVHRIGLWGAVRGYPGRLRPDDYREAPAICAVPRFPFSDNLIDILQCVSGLETAKARLRGARN
jgi:peptidoglycan/xylan/chitin deacetylase (PgdA/CDA1 family)